MMIVSLGSKGCIFGMIEVIRIVLGSILHPGKVFSNVLIDIHSKGKVFVLQVAKKENSKHQLLNFMEYNYEETSFYQLYLIFIKLIIYL